MRSAAVFAIAATCLSVVTAQNFDDSDDYPSACQSICGPIVTRSNTCDDQFDDDNNELTCICTGPNMANFIPQCRDCIIQNNGDDDDLEDITELLNACNFPITAPTGSTATTPSVTVYTTTTRDDDNDLETETITSTRSGGSGATPTVFATTSTDDDGDLQTDTVTSTPSPSAPQTTLMTSTDGSGSTSVMTVTGATGTTTTGNGAVATAAPWVGAGVGVVLAALGAL